VPGESWPLGGHEKSRDHAKAVTNNDPTCGIDVDVGSPGEERRGLVDEALQDVGSGQARPPGRPTLFGTFDRFRVDGGDRR
jgi:hypothetical protein